jgi:hypothetical protein
MGPILVVYDDDDDDDDNAKPQETRWMSEDTEEGIVTLFYGTIHRSLSAGMEMSCSLVNLADVTYGLANDCIANFISTKCVSLI